MTSLDSFKCLRPLKVGSKTYAYYSLPVAEKNGLKGISRLPFSLKVLLENLVRLENGRTITVDDIKARHAQLLADLANPPAAPRQIAAESAWRMLCSGTAVPIARILIAILAFLGLKGLREERSTG